LDSQREKKIEKQEEENVNSENFECSQKEEKMCKTLTVVHSEKNCEKETEMGEESKSQKKFTSRDEAFIKEKDENVIFKDESEKKETEENEKKIEEGNGVT
jgi:hypothetical protein